MLPGKGEIMRTVQVDAIITVARATIAAEKTTDANIRQLAELIGTTSAQAQTMDLPFYATQPAFDHLQVAMAAAFENRSAIVAAHQELGALAKKLGASPESFGDLWPCPEFPKGTIAPTRLRSAA
jgi:hypothetical protein